MKTDQINRKLRGILSADVVGYSRQMEENEAWTVENIEENKRFIGVLIEKYHGHVVDAPGDNLLAEFRSVVNAVECAVVIQKELQEKNANSTENLRMEFRIGVNLGDVIEEEGRIYGNGVNIAARIEKLAKPGGVCISRTTYDQVKGCLNLGYMYIGAHSVKNMNEPVRIYRVLIDSGAEGKVIGEKRCLSRISCRAAVITISALIVIAVASIAWNIHSQYYKKLGIASVEPGQDYLPANGMKAQKSIAVLPFSDFSPVDDQRYFADGITEEIINTLSHVSDLRVIARTSSSRFRDTDKTIQEIGDMLGVEYLLEGSVVRKSENNVRVSAQLINSNDGSHLFSETYDRELSGNEILEVQEDIASLVADSLKLKLGLGRVARRTDNKEAYEMYLVAKGQMYDRNRNAKESINMAISLDPDYGLAWALKGLVHFMIASFYSKANETPLEIQQAYEAASKAVELEPELGKAHLSLGTVYMMKGNFIEAEKSYQKGISLTDKSIDYFDYGLPLHYNVVGRLVKCNELLEEVREKDPFKPSLRSTYILSLGFMGDIAAAEKEYERGKAIFRETWKQGDEVISLLRLSSKENLSAADVVYSSKVFDVAKKHLEQFGEGLAELRTLYRGNDTLSEKEITDISVWAAYFGDSEFAMDALERGVKANAMGLFKIWTPVMKDVRKMPRFKKLLRDTGLVDYWNEFGWPDAYCRPLSDGDFACD